MKVTILYILMTFFTAAAFGANEKISDLPLGSAATTNTNDSFPYVSAVANVTKRLTIWDLINIPTMTAHYAPLASPTFTGVVTAPSFVGTFTGTASGNTTYTPNNHGVVISSATNAMTVIAPDASATKVLKSGGSSADPSWLAYDNANTTSTLVFRDGSGNFSAGTITANLTGTASGNSSYTPNNHGVLVSSATQTATVLSPAGAGTLLGGVASSDPAFTRTPVLGLNGTATGTLGFSGSSTGTVTVQPQAAAGTYNFNLPITAGSSGQPLLSGGGGATAMSFGTLGAGAGGTGQDFSASTGAIQVSSGTFSAGTISIANGGTGQTGASAAFQALSPITTRGDIIAGTTSGVPTRVGAGAVGSYLKSNGTAGLPAFQDFQSSSTSRLTTGSAATFTTPTGCIILHVIVHGGGGGGGGSGTAGGTNGGNGGTTSFGTSFLSAVGGNGGASGPNGGQGGNGGTVSVSVGGGESNTGGGGGSGSFNLVTYNPGGTGGDGGAAGYGQGGGFTTQTGSAASANSGAGGGGAAASSVAGYAGGGGGGGGYISLFIPDPNGTYTYTIGAAGSAGTAGTNGSAGGAGAAGLIVTDCLMYK